MTIVTHALVGAVIGKSIENPYLIVVVSLTSHFALDTLRHGEYISLKSNIKDIWKPLTDIFIGSLIVFLMSYFFVSSQHQLKNVLIGCIFSVLPDSITFLYWKLNCKFLKKIIDFHNWVHRYPRFSPEREWSLKNMRNDILISTIMIAVFLFV